MTEKLKQKIKEEMMSLPKESQEAINSVDWGTISEAIAKKHSFSDSEVNDFQVITGLVLVSILSGENYAKTIENEIGMSKELSEVIANEAIEKIFTPIAEKIEKAVKMKEMGRNHDWDKNLDFIISGGDYSVFVESREGKTSDDKPISNDINK